MPQEYSNDIKRQAKELWEAGAGAKRITQELNLQREKTIYDWVRKYEWRRTSDLDPENDELKIYETLAENAKDFLLDKSFSSITEALKVYEKALIKIKHYKEKSKKSKKNKFAEIFSDDKKIDLDDTEAEVYED